MHKHTIDWLRQVNLTPDTALAEKRWATAEALAENVARARIIDLLRLFLFPPSDQEFTRQLTDDLIAVDPEFPVSHNIQELRLMAGLVMVTIFGDASDGGDVFALGLRAASFPDGRVKAIQPAILLEAEEFMRNKAGRLRPNAFGIDVAQDVMSTLLARGQALSQAEAGGDEAKKTAALNAYREAIPETIARSHRTLAIRIQQLAEESSLLWWVLAEHSDALQQPLSKVVPEAYALPAAAEAAQRTLHLPPPPSIRPLLERALQSCKKSNRTLALVDYLKFTDPTWRAAYLRSCNVADCRDLTPLSAALEKTEELGSAAAGLKALSKLCPGVKGDSPLTPGQAAQQFYTEILFLRALDATTT